MGQEIFENEQKSISSQILDGSLPSVETIEIEIPSTSAEFIDTSESKEVEDKILQTKESKKLKRKENKIMKKLKKATSTNSGDKEMLVYNEE